MVREGYAELHLFVYAQETVGTSFLILVEYLFEVVQPFL